MNFLKKNWITLLLTAFLLSILLIPSFKEFVQRQILMKPSLEKVENEVTFSPEELKLQLKGVNVPDANLADFKINSFFLIFGELGVRLVEQNILAFRNCMMPKKTKYNLYLSLCKTKKKR